jgi:hypothetical protein
MIQERGSETKPIEEKIAELASLPSITLDEDEMEKLAGLATTLDV